MEESNSSLILRVSISEEDFFSRLFTALLRLNTVFEIDKLANILKKVDPRIHPTLAIELIRHCIPKFPQKMAALVTFWEENLDLNFSSLRRLFVGLENSVLIEAATIEDTRFVDSLSVLEGARESEANFEFLKSATVRG